MKLPPAVSFPSPPTGPTQDYSRRLNVAIDSMYKLLAAHIGDLEDGVVFNLDGGRSGEVYTPGQHMDGGVG